MILVLLTVVTFCDAFRGLDKLNAREIQRKTYTHTENFSLSALFPISGGVVGWGGGLCDYVVSPVPIGLGF